ELAEGLERLGLEVARFKTGTPPRVDGRTVDLDALQRQDGELSAYWFAAYTREELPEQRPCWITWAGEDLKRIVQENLHSSALYGGAISGRGPRYCPSIEDKIVRFPRAPRHQVFLEPEGLNTSELYVNGLSTSLPAEVQLAFLRTLPGMGDVRMTKVGYAIEYDYFPPHQLRHTLEVKRVKGLFVAGQVNGTTGYEEAAGQGVVAGINAALQVHGEPPLVLERDQAYIGVLIDDLVTRGVDEPYRLFTSRAEFRLLLRQDNALRRLGPLAMERGLLTHRQGVELERCLREQEAVKAWFAATVLTPESARPLLDEVGEEALTQPTKAVDLIRRPRVKASKVLEAAGCSATGQEDALAAVEVEVKYEGYVAREQERAERVREHANFFLDNDLPYSEFLTLSREAREKLSRVQPSTLAQASRISGGSPADLQNLILEVRRLRTRGRSGAS
ncbi:MAG: tRNA uridine-5-carboxymethylaminomethyl(34) synthesis enzyme MnmG, partial [Gemmatimonadetes bacterium]|nr:tRNA uridine-5-carboxymethylaminomethyl(34) synthesis enzyme MnmG [Gemmatimonadota bacterium]